MRIPGSSSGARAALFAVMALSLAGAPFDRPASAWGPPPETPAASGVAPGRPVYFVGLDGADWQLFDRFMNAGAMPNLSRLVAKGSSGVLKTEAPVLSPILWTTMMTGVSPLEHRVLDFSRFSSRTGQREPVGSDERRAPAVWNIASWAGRRVGVFGLWATFPAEEIHGVVVSDRMSSFLGPREAAPEGAASPSSYLPVAIATQERIEREVGLEELRRFIPGVSPEEFARARSEANPYAGPVPGLWRMLVETRLLDALFQEYVAREKPDLAILYLEATDIAGHLFAPYFPPPLKSTSPADFERYKGVPETFFRWIDSLLGRYAEMARERGAILVLASDHGFYWQEGRPERVTSFATATASRWHRQDGIYLIHGPGYPARPRESEPAGIRRVAATLLALAGLPPGTTMTGPPLAPVPASKAAPVDYTRRFRDELRAAKKSPATAAAAAGSAEELAKLRSLGYLGESEVSAVAGGTRDTRSPGSYNNEGVILRDLGRHEEARAAFERAIAIDPKFASAEWNLSESLWAIGEYDRADALLRSALEHKMGEGQKRLEKRVADRLRIGRTSLEAGACSTALGHFDAAAKLSPQNPTAPAAAGLAYLCLGNNASAAAAFRRSLALDPNQPQLAETVKRLEGK